MSNYHLNLAAVVSFWSVIHELSSEQRHDKTNKMSVRTAKTQISLGIRPVWSESLLSAWRNLWSLATHWAHSEDSDQTGRMLGAHSFCWFCHVAAHLSSIVINSKWEEAARFSGRLLECLYLCGFKSSVFRHGDWGGLRSLIVAVPDDILADTWQYQQNSIRPVWSESSLSAWRKLGSSAPYWAHRDDWSDWADQSLRWAYMPFCWFCHETAHFHCLVLRPSCFSFLITSCQNSCHINWIYFLIIAERFRCVRLALTWPTRQTWFAELY